MRDRVSLGSLLLAEGLPFNMVPLMTCNPRSSHTLTLLSTHNYRHKSLLVWLHENSCHVDGRIISCPSLKEAPVYAMLKGDKKGSLEAPFLII
jgi:hypothetical protein